MAWLLEVTLLSYKAAESRWEWGLELFVELETTVAIRLPSTDHHSSPAVTLPLALQAGVGGRVPRTSHLSASDPWASQLWISPEQKPPWTFPGPGHEEQNVHVWGGPQPIQFGTRPYRLLRPGAALGQTTGRRPATLMFPILPLRR